MEESRPDARGVGNGIDRERSLRLYNRVDGVTQGALRSIMTGAVFTRTSRARLPANRGLDVTCNLCHLEPETLDHLWWRCPSFIRQRNAQLPEGIEGQPAALRQLGIAPVGLDARFNVAEIQRMMVSIFRARATMDA